MTTMTTTMMMTMTMTTTSFFDAITNLVVGRIPDRGGGGDFDGKAENNDVDNQNCDDDNNDHDNEDVVGCLA